MKIAVEYNNGTDFLDPKDWKKLEKFMREFKRYLKCRGYNGNYDIKMDFQGTEVIIDMEKTEEFNDLDRACKEFSMVFPEYSIMDMED